MDTRITTLQQINCNNETGKLLLAALAIITTKVHTDKTPDQCIQILNDSRDVMFKVEPRDPAEPINFGDGEILKRRTAE